MWNSTKKLISASELHSLAIDIYDFIKYVDDYVHTNNLDSEISDFSEAYSDFVDSAECLKEQVRSALDLNDLAIYSELYIKLELKNKEILNSIWFAQMSKYHMNSMYQDSNGNMLKAELELENKLDHRLAEITENI